jgi:polysaccharide biosynthesis protein PelD
MKRNEDQLVERVRPVPPWVVALESLLLAAAVPLIGRWLSREDPFFTQAPVSWALLAPMLAGLRHGFMAGFGCAAGLSFALIGSMRYQWLPVPAPPIQLMVALLLTGMLAGQFSHLWATQARKIAGLYSYQRQRFDEFARNYQLLKVSHDSLEERNAAARGNLRTALTTLRGELLRAPGADSALQARAPVVLEVFQAFGFVQAAALLPVSSSGKVEGPCATLGRVTDRVAFDPLVALAVKARRVVSLSHLGREGAGEMTTSLAAAVPLVDVDGRVWAVLAVQELPFFALTQETLALYALMAGALADTLEFGATVKSYDARSTQRFEQRVRRCLVDARRHGVPASLAVFAVSNAARAGELLPRVLEERRGIDEACLALTPDGGLRLFVLLPLTDAKGAEAYIRRLDKTLQQKLRVSLGERGVKLLQSVELGDNASNAVVTQLKLLANPKSTSSLATG